MTLAQGVARLGTKMPFAQAVADLAFFWNVDLDETTVRRYTQAAGAAYVAEQTAELEQLERERPPVADKPAVQYLSADGAMVPLVGGEWAEVKTLAIGSVELRPGKDGLPNAQTSELTYFSRLADAETFIRHAYVETHRRGTEVAKVVCAVQDGAEWLQGLVDVLRPDAVRILDFPHALEHVSASAQPVFGIGTLQFTAWLDEQAHTLKHSADGARQVLAAMAKLPVHLGVDPTAAADARDHALTYFTKRLAQGAVRRVPGRRLPDRQWQHRKRQQVGGRSATERQWHALGACQRRPAGGIAHRRLRQPLGRGLAADQRALARHG